jgi:hypothetical protein
MKKQANTFRSLRLPLLLVAGLILMACARTVTVTVPPRVDLDTLPTIGVIDFAAQPPGELTQEATQKFLGNLQAAQPGVRLLELGSREQVLREVGHTELDFQAIRAIGAHYGVAAVLSGTVELSEPRPDLKISPNLTSVTAQAKIDGKMSAKLWETAGGATVWTNSSWGNWAVGGVSIANGGAASAGFRHPREKRNEVLMALIKALNGDFWPTYEKRRVEN